MSAIPSDLAEYRRRIDEIDDRMHDLIIERAAVVAEIAASKGVSGVGFYQPGREAQILRRLAARHRGTLPVASVMRIWRELLAATVRLETRFAVAVFAPADKLGLWDLARDHYGSQAPMTAYGSVGEVICAVGEGEAAVGILPMPQQRDPDPWWRHLVSRNDQAPRVVARLPFAGRGNARSDSADALVIGQFAPVASGCDRTLIVAESSAGIGRRRFVRLLSQAGLGITLVAAWEHAAGTLNLIEIDGFVTVSDLPITSLRVGPDAGLSRLVPFGGYAVPLFGDLPSGAIG